MLTILCCQQHRDFLLTETNHTRIWQGQLQKTETQGSRKLSVNREVRMVLKKSNQNSQMKGNS